MPQEYIAVPKLSWIQEEVRSGMYHLSEHVIRFLTAGLVTVTEMEAAIGNGKIVKTHINSKKNKSCVIKGHAKDKIISVLCAAENDASMIILMTFLESLPPWEKLSCMHAEKDQDMSATMGSCFFCGGKIKPIVVGNFDYRLEGNLYVIKDVPAGLCLECGEKYISADTGKKINTLIEAGVFNGVEAVRVVRYT